MARLDKRTRTEIAEEVWRLFGLECKQIGLSFDTEGVTIRVPFNDKVDLDGPKVVVGLVKGHKEYSEVNL